jgi:hypothetical protein
MNKSLNYGFISSPLRIAILDIAEQFCGHINILNYGKFAIALMNFIVW